MNLRKWKIKDLSQQYNMININSISKVNIGETTTNWRNLQIFKNNNDNIKVNIL